MPSTTTRMNRVMPHIVHHHQKYSTARQADARYLGYFYTMHSQIVATMGASFASNITTLLAVMWWSVCIGYIVWLWLEVCDECDSPSSLPVGDNSLPPKEEDQRQNCVHQGAVRHAVDHSALVNDAAPTWWRPSAPVVVGGAARDAPPAGGGAADAHARNHVVQHVHVVAIANDEGVLVGLYRWEQQAVYQYTLHPRVVERHVKVDAVMRIIDAIKTLEACKCDPPMFPASSDHAFARFPADKTLSIYAIANHESMIVRFCDAAGHGVRMCIRYPRIVERQIDVDAVLRTIEILEAVMCAPSITTTPAATTPAPAPATAPAKALEPSMPISVVHLWDRGWFGGSE